MRLRNILYYLAVIVLIAEQAFAQNTNPVVTNVAFSISGTTVTVTYDVADAEQATVTISMEVSSDNGATWNFNYGEASRDIGTVNSQDGLTKTITWTYSGAYNDQFIIKIIADDLVGDQIYYSGQVYNTVTIGSQVWLKENLNVGTMINSLTGGDDGDGNQTKNLIIEKYCYNDNVDIDYCATYGGLYQWAEAVQYLNGATNISSPDPAFLGNVQGKCPTGWHIPTIAEFQTLKAAASGNALKAVGQGNGTGTNTSGFSALLAGDRVNEFNFGNLGNSTYFWSSTEKTAEYSGYDATFALFLYLYDNEIISDIGVDSKGLGFSVRCLKD
jgi:uncharacterized protein (TIGR02145 family)